MVVRKRKSRSKAKPAKKKRGKHSRKKNNWWGRFWRYVVPSGLLVVALYVVFLDFSIRIQFEGKKWALPARVYARPLDIYPGKAILPSELGHELRLLNYRQVRYPKDAGSYSREGDDYIVITRPFVFWDGKESSRKIRIHFDGDRVASIASVQSGNSVPLVRFDPGLVGSIYPSHNEDRILVLLEDVPEQLVEGLLAIEDRKFYQHHGIDIYAIGRALLENIRAGRTVQGGSTLTQQLVKNYFLSNDRTLWRKLNEALMSLLLEWHYDKQEIVQAYLNEVYLGQDGKRSIHGFGLASQFYFHRPLNKLDTDQIAMLVGLVKGASYYDPRKHPQRAIERRNLVLDVWAEQKVISEWRRKHSQGQLLGVSKKAPSGITAYPAFIDLVRRQLRRDYQDEDLSSEGLQIFTSFDPIIQRYAEQGLVQHMRSLEQRHGISGGSLQGAVVITSTDSGEVLAVIGGRNPGYAGFNRALDAIRQIGSLIKPAVYLTALSDPDRYTLASLLDDSPIALQNQDGTIWAPQNYDKEFHGDVPVYKALAHSYNVPTAKLGLDIGLGSVVDTIEQLGVLRSVGAYPSMLLGAVSLSPIEVAQIYQTLAGGGFRTPLRSIMAVLTVQGEPLQRYPLMVEEKFDSGASFLVNRSLQLAVKEGTGRSLYNILPQELGVAGKTGTTDDLRDSWFAGYTGNYLGVVWLGMDDNRSSGLTGSSGALQVWGNIMRRIRPQALQLTPPANIEFSWIDSLTGLRSEKDCENAVQLPFIKGSVPEDKAPCRNRGVNWIKSIFQ